MGAHSIASMLCATIWLDAINLLIALIRVMLAETTDQSALIAASGFVIAKMVQRLLDGSLELTRLKDGIRKLGRHPAWQAAN